LTTLFRPTTPADTPALIRLLTRAFSSGPETPAFQPDMLRWKYWEPREDWLEPRAYVLEREGKLVAHAGLWPVVISRPDGQERGVHMIDWASDPDSPGAGVSLLQRFTRMFSFVCAIGGSDMTRDILPKFGFEYVAETLTFARPLRPWRQIVVHQSKDLRLPARLGRNLWWAMLPPRKTPSGWTAVEVAPGHVSADSTVMPERDGRFFQYLARCPAARCFTCEILKNERRAGFFALSLVQRQARIAGIWLDAASQENWQAAFELAQAVALRSRDACEIVAQGTYDPVAAAAAGMRIRGRDPVFLYRKGGRMDDLPLRFQMADYDAAFLAGSAPEFVC
jgi:hypothetical protein